MSIQKDLFSQMFYFNEFVILHLYWTTLPSSKKEFQIFAGFMDVVENIGAFSFIHG